MTRDLAFEWRRKRLLNTLGSSVGTPNHFLQGPNSNWLQTTELKKQLRKAVKARGGFAFVERKVAHSLLIVLRKPLANHPAKASSTTIRPLFQRSKNPSQVNLFGERLAVSVNKLKYETAYTSGSAT